MIEKICARLEAEINEFMKDVPDGDYLRGNVNFCAIAKGIVQEVVKEYDTCYKDCGECEAYNKEKHHCPKFCKVIAETVKEIESDNGWIPCSERLPECCGYPVLLTVENAFGQRSVCKAFTNYMQEGKLLFYTNEKEYCSGLTSSKLSDAWKPIAWMELPAPYQKGE